MADLPQVRSVKRTCGRGTAVGKRPEDVGRRTKTFRKFVQLRGPAEEGLLREKDWKTSEGELQVYSIKKTCGSETEVRGRRHGVSPYKWRHFLEGAPNKFEIWTDHKNLEYFMSAKKLNRRQARWSLTLARFDFVMHHRPGKTMGKSDALSRRADHGSGSEDNRDITLLTPNFFAICTLEGTRVEGEEQELLKLIRRETRDGELEDAISQVTKLLKTSSAKSVRSSEWSEEDGMLHFAVRSMSHHLPT